MSDLYERLYQPPAEGHSESARNDVQPEGERWPDASQGVPGGATAEEAPAERSATDYVAMDQNTTVPQQRGRDDKMNGMGLVDSLRPNMAPGVQPKLPESAQQPAEVMQPQAGDTTSKKKFWTGRKIVGATVAGVMAAGGAGGAIAGYEATHHEGATVGTTTEGGSNKFNLNTAPKQQNLNVTMQGYFTGKLGAGTTLYPNGSGAYGEIPLMGTNVVGPGGNKATQISVSIVKSPEGMDPLSITLPHKIGNVEGGYVSVSDDETYVVEPVGPNKEDVLVVDESKPGSGPNGLQDRLHDIDDAVNAANRVLFPDQG